MRDDLPAVVRAVVKAAKGGDVAAARLVLERLLPRGRVISIELPAMRAETAPEAIAAVIRSMSAGEIAPGEARDIVDLVQRFVEIAQRAEIEQRLSALEEGRR